MIYIQILISYKQNYRHYISFSKWQFLVIFNSHPFESTGSHNLPTIFEDLIIFPFVLQSLTQWSLSFTLYIQHGFLWYTHKHSYICLVNSVTLQKSIHLLTALAAVESSLYAPITNVPAVLHHPKHLSCHLSSYYSLDIQIKLLFHLTRSRIAWARNLEAGRFSFSLLGEECTSGALYKWRDHRRFTDMPSEGWQPVD